MKNWSIGRSRFPVFFLMIAGNVRLSAFLLPSKTASLHDFPIQRMWVRSCALGRRNACVRKQRTSLSSQADNGGLPLFAETLKEELQQLWGCEAGKEDW